MWKDTEKRFDDEFPKDRFTHCNCECIGCDAEQDRVDLKAFIRSEQEKLLQELEEEISGMAFVGPNEAGQFALHADGYNQAIEEVQELLKKKY